MARKIFASYPSIAAFVEAIILLAHKLDLQVVAEGVEGHRHGGVTGGDFHAQRNVHVVAAQVHHAAVGRDVLDGDFASGEDLVLHEVAQQGVVLIRHAQDDVGRAGLGVGEAQGAWLLGADGLLSFAVDRTSVRARLGKAKLALDALQQLRRDGVFQLVGDRLRALDGHLEDVDEHAFGQSVPANDVA
mgnify:CR=1 FL=1